jgi:quercetin dioxygenase-like cupin family protein
MLQLASRVIAASLFLASLANCAPQARAQSAARPVTAAPPAAGPVAVAAPRDTTPPMVNGVETVGLTSSVALERTLSGHLVSLNGRYKLRGTMTVFDPGGYMGAHHHAGPGLRYVLAGDLTYTQAGRSHVFHRGDWFYESGDTLSTAANHSVAPDTILNFEILPADWFGPSTMPAPGSR